MRIKMLLIALCCLLAGTCLAEEAERNFDYLPDGLHEAIATAFAGFAIQEAASIGGPQNAELVLLSKDEINIAAIVEEIDGAFVIAETSEYIIPDGLPFDDQWWVSDKWGTGEIFIWYTPIEGEEFYYVMQRDEEGHFVLTEGFFDSADGSARPMGFSIDNKGTALRVYGDSYFSAVYAPYTIDLSFSGFDPIVLKEFLSAALMQMNMPGLIPSTLEPDALPQGQSIPFEKGQALPVYAGPGKQYARLGETQNATVSTNGWIEVFGEENGWLLIQYNLSEGHNRFGYIEASYLPEKVKIPPLSFVAEPGVTSCWITDDPLRTTMEIFEPEEMLDVIKLAALGDEWLYVEFPQTPTGAIRGFVPTDAVDMRKEHEGKAIIQVKSAPIYADIGATEQIGEYFGGTELEVLSTKGGLAHVRIGTGQVFQEGYIPDQYLSFDAVPKDVAYTMDKATISLITPEKQQLAYAAPSQDAKRIQYDIYPEYAIMGTVGSFVHIVSLWHAEDFACFVPEAWLIPFPKEHRPYQDTVRIELTEDTPVYTKPDMQASSHVTLYKGVSVKCHPVGDFYYMEDSLFVPQITSYGGSYGYIPASACKISSDAFADLSVGTIEPASDADSLHYNVSVYGSINGEFGYGTRMLLLGHAYDHYLVLAPNGRYGFVDQKDICETEQTGRQNQPEALYYGEALLAENPGYYHRPYSSIDAFVEYPVGTKMHLTGCMGDWWSICIGETTGYLPSHLILNAPTDVPTYDGIYNDFRDMPFYFSYHVTPPLLHRGDDAWLLLHEDKTDMPVLTHMQRQGDGWAEVEHTVLQYGEGIRLFTSFDFDTQSPEISYAFTCYPDAENTELIATFQQQTNGFRLTRFQMREKRYADTGETETLFNYTFLPTESGWQMATEQVNHSIQTALPTTILQSEYQAMEVFVALRDAVMGAEVSELDKRLLQADD